MQEKIRVSVVKLYLIRPSKKPGYSEPELDGEDLCTISLSKCYHGITEFASKSKEPELDEEDLCRRKSGFH